jgi:hypothetical protein
MSYEGWKNWQTWNTASWCDKDKLIHRDRMRRRPRTAEECEAFVRDWFPNGTPDMTTNRDPYGAHVREAVDPGSSSARNASRLFSTESRLTVKNTGRGNPKSAPARGRNRAASTPRGHTVVR